MADEIPPVCLIPDLCRILRTSPRTIARLRRAGAFPIRELCGIDKRPRWSGEDVRAYLAHKGKPQSWRRIA